MQDCAGSPWGLLPNTTVLSNVLFVSFLIVGCRLLSYSHTDRGLCLGDGDEAQGLERHVCWRRVGPWICPRQDSRCLWSEVQMVQSRSFLSAPLHQHLFGYVSVNVCSRLLLVPIHPAMMLKKISRHRALIVTGLWWRCWPRTAAWKILLLSVCLVIGEPAIDKFPTSFQQVRLGIKLTRPLRQQQLNLPPLCARVCLAWHSDFAPETSWWRLQSSAKSWSCRDYTAVGRCFVPVMLLTSGKLS